MPKTKPPISYTNRDYASIRNDLINYVKVYYPDTYKDFNEASFGSLMFDMVAYVGDVLSYYIDYQTNETFIETAIERNNLIKVSKQLGYKFTGSPSSSGVAAFYVSIPAQSNGGQENTDLIPILKQGTTMTSDSGASFILTEDVDFSLPATEILVIQENANSTPTGYAYKAYGKVISGEIRQKTVTVGEFQKFLKLQVDDERISEIISVIDTLGNEYYEVDYLTQDTIYKPIKNSSSDSTEAPFFLKEFQTFRKFITEFDEDGNCYLQFGAGSESSFVENNFPDPSNVSLQFFGKNYYTEKIFDPNLINSTETLGISPTNTALTITYRVNTSDTINAAVGSVNTITNPIVEFRTNLYSKTEALGQITSFEIDNEEPMVGSSELPTNEELRLRAYGAFATQNRAVTKQDYVAIAYRMPSKFGTIKRATVIQDKDSARRNLNLYIVSTTSDGELTLSSDSIKQNLKTWLSKYKMLNDTVDILDAIIVNIGIRFRVITDLTKDTNIILNDCIVAVKSQLKEKLNIGEPFYLTDIYKTLNAINGVVDTTKVEVFQKTGEGYSSSQFSVYDNLSKDGRYLSVPENVIIEIRDLDSDITGEAV
jgi:hypothetical protein